MKVTIRRAMFQIDEGYTDYDIYVDNQKVAGGSYSHEGDSYYSDDLNIEHCNSYKEFAATIRKSLKNYGPYAVFNKWGYVEMFYQTEEEAKQNCNWYEDEYVSESLY